MAGNVNANTTFTIFEDETATTPTNPQPATPVTVRPPAAVERRDQENRRIVVLQLRRPSRSGLRLHQTAAARRLDGIAVTRVVGRTVTTTTAAGVTMTGRTQVQAGRVARRPLGARLVNPENARMGATRDARVNQVQQSLNGVSGATLPRIEEGRSPLGDITPPEIARRGRGRRMNGNPIPFALPLRPRPRSPPAL